MKYGILFSLSFMLMSVGCETKTQQTDAAGEQPSGRHETPASSDFTIAPGKAMGKMTVANCTKEAVIAAYGSDNVKEDSVYVGEGFSLPGLLVFPGTKNELQIAYDPQISPTQPAFLRVETEGGDWKTASGLKIGSTFQEVITANGKDFKFSGFGWDYGGAVTNWEGGNLEGLLVRLDLTTNDMPSDKFVGDREVSSNDPDLAKLGIKVASISLRF